MTGTLGFMLGLPELAIILVLALLLFGSRLPSIARAMGRSISEFKQGYSEGKTDGSGPPGEKEEDGAAGPKAGPGTP